MPNHHFSLSLIYFFLQLFSALVCYGTKAIEGILFDKSIPKQIHITTKSFEMMKKLRLLKIYWAHESTSMGRIPK